MSKAIANVDDLKRLQRAARKAEEDIQQAIKQLNKELARADWHDDRRRDFESKLKDATSAVQRTTRQLQALQPILQRAISDLSNYLKRS